MEKVTNILACVGLAVLLVGLGYVAGRRSARVVCAENAHTTCDTLWEVIHDTCWRVESAEVIRTDTVRLAAVSILERVDTVAVHDSVYVEVPIEQKVFTGENWRVTAHGFRVGIDDVWINRPTVYVTKTQTVTRRWRFSVGAQTGYGYTVHGGSPYVGIGVGFGYTF